MAAKGRKRNLSEISERLLCRVRIILDALVGYGKVPDSILQDLQIQDAPLFRWHGQ